MNQRFFASSIVIALFFAVSCQALAPESPSRRKAKAAGPAIAESQQSSTSAEGESEFTAEDLAAMDQVEKGLILHKRPFPASPKKVAISPKKQRQIPPLQSFNGFPQTYFSPSIKDVLLKLMHDEQEGIRAAVYRFTLYDVAQAWANAKVQKNVTGRLIVDKGYQEDFCAALRLLNTNGVSLYTLKSQEGQFETMHHKVFLFYKNISDKKLVVTGSFNVTGAAHANNYENMIIVDDANIFKKYEEELDRIQVNMRPISANRLTCTVNKTAIGRALNQIPGDEPN